MTREETKNRGEYHFHYSEDERLKAASSGRRRDESAGSGRKGLFRRNRSLAIILLDIVVIVIMFLIFQFVFTPGRSSARVGDYRAELSAFRFEDEVYATVEISRIREQSDTPVGEDSLVVIQFGDQDEILDVLPISSGEKISATAVIPWKEDEAVHVTLRMLDETREITSTPRE